ncbi:MAG: ATP-binding protein [Spirochaetales bacterium]|jgi:hypothetical protein|nr:ATP-binding protein [Spirochaetales bacterium]
MSTRKLPVGIQDFEGIRTDSYVYVDKTAYIFKLAGEGKPYFLSRPRRFGKSLLLSAIKAYFLGKRDLFEGLAIAELEKEWAEYPVFHIDMNGENYSGGLAALESGLAVNLKSIEREWGKETTELSPASHFRELIRRAHEKSGKKVVVLIDEYDKPLLETMDNPRLNEEVRKNLKAFYGVLKTSDPYLRFVLLTGVTKFSQVSVFSDLNQLRDISMEEAYAGICGISEAELTVNFQPELHALAEKNGKSYREIMEEMREKYNGYHFSRNSEGMYNPFSVLNTFASLRFNYYWFQTGTPTFLVKMLADDGFYLPSLVDNVRIDPQAVSDYRPENTNPIPVLYQSGYLTIKGYDEDFQEYILGFPNKEVQYGFLKELIALYKPKPGPGEDFDVRNFVRDLKAADAEGFMKRLQSYIANIPYELNDKSERYYQTLFFLIFSLMGQFTRAEVKSAAGRADMVVNMRDAVYVFEFKLVGNGTAEDALKQIDDKGYLIPYAASGKKLVKIGVEFDAEKRNVGRWLVVNSA